ncbi:MAG TPA: hypothetical protein VLZ10_14825 [Thermodesulfobacteriota bacterium]|nr:hypothetical protein [Thermodesulfobacteriota bacterium]
MRSIRFRGLQKGILGKGDPDNTPAPGKSVLPKGYNYLCIVNFFAKAQFIDLKSYTKKAEFCVNRCSVLFRPAYPPKEPPKVFVISEMGEVFRGSAIEC